MDSNEAAKAVARAWTDPGNHPAYHRAAQRTLRADWPTLAHAVEALVKAVRDA